MKKAQPALRRRADLLESTSVLPDHRSPEAQSLKNARAARGPCCTIAASQKVGSYLCAAAYGIPVCFLRAKHGAPTPTKPQVALTAAADGAGCHESLCKGKIGRRKRGRGLSAPRPRPYCWLSRRHEARPLVIASICNRTVDRRKQVLRKLAVCALNQHSLAAGGATSGTGCERAAQ